MRLTLGATVVAFVMGIAVADTSVAAPSKSTRKERTHIVLLSKQYEADILAPGAKGLASEIMKWWTEVPDLKLNWCGNLLTDEAPASQELAGAILLQAVFAAGVFVIDSPELAQDRRATWVAGLDGALRAYQTLLSKDESHRDAVLDKLVELKATGKLGEYVDAHSVDCR